MSTSAEKRALDDLKASVRELADAVHDGPRVDRETIERIVRDVVGRSNGLPAYRGYVPGDERGDEFEAPGIAGVYGSAHDIGAPNPQRLAMRGRERLGEILTSSPVKVERATGITAARVREFQEVSDGLVLASAYLGVPAQELELYRVFEPLARAMDTGTAGEGSEFVPRELSGDLIERVSMKLKVAALFPGVDMPTGPSFDIPGFSVSRQRTGTKAEETGDTGQAKFQLLTPGSRKITLNAKKLGARAILSKEIEEDALIAMIPFLRGELVDFLAADMEDAVLNGDDTAPHQDSDVTDYTDPADPRTVWNGLRFLTAAGQKTDMANVAPTVAAIRVNRKKLGKYGADPASLAHIVSVSSFIQLLSDASVLTMEKYGPQATILQGELGSVDGSPLIVSDYVRQDLNATGVYDGVTTNRTVVLTVNRRGFVTGQRRAVTLDVFREIYAESDQDLVIASMRRAFTPRFPTSEPVVALHFNVAT